MTLLAPSAGEVAMLQNLLYNNATPENLTLKLYSNNHVPASGDTAASYTEVSTTNTGYAAKTLTNGSGWTVVSATPSYATYGAQAFNFSGAGCPVTVYGYFIVGASSGTIYWAELLYPGGQVFNSNDSLTITPKISLT